MGTKPIRTGEIVVFNIDGRVSADMCCTAYVSLLTGRLMTGGVAMVHRSACLLSSLQDIPIVHRVIKVHERPDGDSDILTKVSLCGSYSNSNLVHV
jgi:hypothetical protein